MTFSERHSPGGGPHEGAPQTDDTAIKKPSRETPEERDARMREFLEKGVARGEEMLSAIGRLQRTAEEEREMRELAERDALLDPKTGIYNARGLKKVGAPLVEQLMSEAGGRNPDRRLSCLAVAMLDIDHFKAANSKLGHLKADEVLIHVARFLEEHVRARRGDVVARWGGEEFVILFPDAKAKYILASRFPHGKLDVPEITLSDGTRYKTTISVGIADCKPGEALDQVLGRANAAMHTAKEEGRDQVRIFEEGMAPETDGADEKKAA